MKCNLTDEAIRTIIGNAPEGAEYWTEGYDVQYRKLVLDCVFGWFPDDKKWVRAIDNDIAMERVDKGFWLRNLVEELVDRQSKPIPQTKEVEWKNGDRCIYNDEEFTFVSYMCKPEEDHVVIWRSFDGIEVVYKTQISKPETPEAKKEREDRERGIHELSMGIAENVKVIDGSVSDYRHDIAVYLYDAGYRVGK